jgi:hypothetical protein
MLPNVSASQLERVLLPGFFEMIRNIDVPTENPVVSEDIGLHSAFYFQVLSLFTKYQGTSLYLGR